MTPKSIDATLSVSGQIATENIAAIAMSSGVSRSLSA
jgi:protein tyrosine phosphatase (PTP) superfamily phosphohydrolase (DUF442 family)